MSKLNFVLLVFFIVLINGCKNNKKQSINYLDYSNSDSNRTVESGVQLYFIKKIKEKDFSFFSTHYKNEQYYNYTQQKKINGELVLNLNSKKTIKFKDSINYDHEEDSEKYNYLAFNNYLNSYFIKLERWEQNDILMINKENGNIDTLWSLPILSPQKKHLLELSSSWGLEGIPNGIRVYKYEKNKLKLYFQIIQSTWIPKSSFWKNENTILIKVLPTNKYTADNNTINNDFKYLEISF